MSREGRLPERTIYVLTDPGRIELQDWLTDLVGTPAKEYPDFEAALALLPALPPNTVLSLLQERATRLEVELVQAHAAHEVAEKRQVPRLLWIESEFHATLIDAELGYVRRLAQEIATGTLDGLGWWRQVHNPDGPVASPAFTDNVFDDSRNRGTKEEP